MKELNLKKDCALKQWLCSVCSFESEARTNFFSKKLFHKNFQQNNWIWNVCDVSFSCHWNVIYLLFLETSLVNPVISWINAIFYFWKCLDWLRWTLMLCCCCQNSEFYAKKLRFEEAILQGTFLEEYFLNPPNKLLYTIKWMVPISRRWGSWESCVYIFVICRYNVI